MTVLFDDDDAYSLGELQAIFVLLIFNVGNLNFRLVIKREREISLLHNIAIASIIGVILYNKNSFMFVR